VEYLELSQQDRAVLQRAIDAADRLYVRGIQEVAAIEHPAKVRITDLLPLKSHWLNRSGTP
jgi:hypothetical protein